MIRRSFRFGLWLGLLVGIAFALVKMVQRTRPAPEPAPWTPPPRVQAPVVPEPEPVLPSPEPEPILPRPEPDQPVPEPIVPEPAPEPVVPDPAPEPLVPDPKPEPPAPAPRAAKKTSARAAPTKRASASKRGAEPPQVGEVKWIAPVGGICPESHPVKAKLASRIFHVAGGHNYSRTTPDRCYETAGDAEADGLRPSKR